MQPPLWPQLLLQVILIAINAYFAATEIAVISLNEAVIRHQAEEGDKKAARLLHIVEQPTGFLSTIQIGITLAGFLGSAFAADNLAGRLPVVRRPVCLLDRSRHQSAVLMCRTLEWIGHPLR